MYPILDFVLFALLFALVLGPVMVESSTVPSSPAVVVDPSPPYVSVGLALVPSAVPSAFATRCRVLSLGLAPSAPSTCITNLRIPPVVRTLLPQSCCCCFLLLLGLATLGSSDIALDLLCVAGSVLSVARAV